MRSIKDSGVMGTVWRDCNAAGMKHSWRLSHSLDDGATYWLCRRKGCSVGTRTDTPFVRPYGFLGGFGGYSV